MNYVYKDYKFLKNGTRAITTVENEVFIGF